MSFEFSKTNVLIRRGKKHREEYLVKTQREESHVVLCHCTSGKKIHNASIFYIIHTMLHFMFFIYKCSYLIIFECKICFTSTYDFLHLKTKIVVSSLPEYFFLTNTGSSCSYLVLFSSDLYGILLNGFLLAFLIFPL